MSLDAVTPIVWLEDLDKDSVGIAGGKGANLGELAHAGFPVPPGFVVTAPRTSTPWKPRASDGSLADGGFDASGISSTATPAKLKALIHKAGMPALLRTTVVDRVPRIG